MRKVIIMFALAMGIATANAQENVTVETTNGSEHSNEQYAYNRVFKLFQIKFPKRRTFRRC